MSDGYKVSPNGWILRQSLDIGIEVRKDEGFISCLFEFSSDDSTEAFGCVMNYTFKAKELSEVDTRDWGPFHDAHEKNLTYVKKLFEEAIFGKNYIRRH